MPIIKPISDLRNYGEVLRDVEIGTPVFLTKNGHGKYAVIDIDEYKELEKLNFLKRLKSELELGKLSGEQGQWIDAKDVRKKLTEKYRV